MQRRDLSLVRETGWAEPQRKGRKAGGSSTISLFLSTVTREGENAVIEEQMHARFFQFTRKSLTCRVKYQRHLAMNLHTPLDSRAGGAVHSNFSAN